MKEFEFFTNDTITLWRLRVVLGERMGEAPEKLALYRMKRLLDSKMNGKSIREINISKGDVIRIETASATQIPKANLVNDSSDRLAPKFEGIVRKWFQMYKRPNTQFINAEGLFKFYDQYYDLLFQMLSNDKLKPLHAEILQVPLQSINMPPYPTANRLSITRPSNHITNQLYLPLINRSLPREEST